MKVKFKDHIKKQLGTVDGIIYYMVPGCNKIIGRRVPKMPHQPMNDKYKNVSLALKAIDPSPGFRQNLKDYLVDLKENDESITWLNWHNVYVKMMWNLAANYPSVNLETITREQIINEDLPCKSVKEAIDAELLPEVQGYNQYSSPI